LSAVSQQILGIQQGLLDNASHVDLLGRSIRLDPNMAIFITMNPGYAGRSNLPDNLKTLFRSVAMVTPDRKLIAQVMLYSQGIVSAEKLAPSVVDLFLLCEERMTKQRHYDFGLRALKTLLVSAGGLKRKAIEGKDYIDLVAEDRLSWRMQQHLAQIDSPRHCGIPGNPRRCISRVVHVVDGRRNVTC
jgi:dynein heavy chain 1, cytosolic